MLKSPLSDEVIRLANRLADASGELIRQYYRGCFVVEGKKDLSPVTIVDRKVEQCLRVMLAQERPDDGIIGEEFGKEREESPYVWVLDPIDGTRAFASGKPLFGTLLALLHEGTPVLGVIDQPVLRERWVGAQGHKTLFNGNPCCVRECASLNMAISNLGPQAFPFGNAVSLDAYRRVAKASLTTTVGGDCYSYGLIASGHIDLAIEHDLKLYDFAALVPVIEGAGGFMRDWKGRLLDQASTGNILAAGDKRLMDEAVELLEGTM